MCKEKYYRDKRRTDAETLEYNRLIDEHFADKDNYKQFPEHRRTVRLDIKKLGKDEPRANITGHRIKGTDEANPRPEDWAAPEGREDTDAS